MPFQPLPLNLVAALPELPFDVYVQHQDRMVLYAVHGMDSRAIVSRARSGLQLQAPVADPQAMRRLLLAWLVRDLEARAVADERGGSRDLPAVADAADTSLRRIVAVLGTLLEPLFEPQPRLDAEAFGAGQAAIDLFAQSLAIDRGLGRAILTRPEPHGVATASPGWRWAVRAIDAVAVGVPLALDVGIAWSDLRPVARALGFRDIGMPRVLHERRRGDPLAARSGEHRPRAARRHVDLSVGLLSAVPSAGEPCIQLVREHHERFDGSGYPAGRRGSPDSPAASIVALADAFVPILSPASVAPASTAEEAIRRLYLAAAGHHDPVIMWGLVRLLAGGRLLPMGGMTRQ